MPIWILPDELGEIPDGKMPTAKQIYSFFYGTIPVKLLDYAQTQTATLNRIESAIYHYQIMDVAYGFGTVGDYPRQHFVARTEMNAIVLNLMGAFDCIAHEINMVFNLPIPERNVMFGHTHFGGRDNCIICRVSYMHLTLSTYLEQIVASSWFNELKEYRNHIHKRLPVIQVAIVVGGGNGRRVTLPDNPSNYNPQSSDYSRRLEIQAYCRDRIDDVINAIEHIYQLMHGKIAEYVTIQRDSSI